ncbi:hypothetical protein B0H63DRAFT_468267 [Podospora didyma]|uniref:Uncharacterized protein n=1 Tax=Podospora didyma TaxID=330526 RepID=A0AAE0NS66_9PEZI|nr:hypothetical protein B0H63DRAFT_468267 [Podospora didyma]
MDMPADTPPAAIRSIFSEALDVHVTSVAAVTLALIPLLHKSAAPKVANVTFDLGRITNLLTPVRRMARTTAYDASEVGMMFNRCRKPFNTAAGPLSLVHLLAAWQANHAEPCSKDIG